MPRMRILSAADQARLEHPPFFDSAERKRYFDFPQFTMDVAQGLRGPGSCWLTAAVWMISLLLTRWTGNASHRS